MSVTNIVCQPRHNTLHVMTDGAAYVDAVLTSIGNKIHTIPNWPGVVTGRGTAVAAPVVAWELSQRFGSFDAVVDGIEGELPDIMRMYNLSDKTIELSIAGWSTERQRPEAYVIVTTDELPTNFTEATRHLIPPAMTLKKLPDFCTGPILSEQIVLDAQWNGVNIDASPENVIDALRFTIECQRHMKLPDGKCYIGGFAAVATVTPDSITQRILHRWIEDVVGEEIRPPPPNWKAFKAYGSHTPPSNLIPAGLSRLQRERMEKKFRKGTLRAV